MWNLWSRIVRPKKRKKLDIQVGTAYDVFGKTMVVATVSKGTDDFGIILVSVEDYKMMQREGLTFDFRQHRGKS